MKGRIFSRNEFKNNLKPSNSYISLSKSVLGNRTSDKSLTYSTRFTISQQDRFKDKKNLLLYETTDLSGVMFKKKFKDPTPTFGNWDNFMNRSFNQDPNKTIK